MTDEFSTILEKHNIRGWLHHYIEHTRDMEAPTSFHFFTGLSVLGAVCKRRVYVDQVKFRLFPCYQILLAGPAGKVKKTTAGNYGIGLGEETGEFTTLMASGSPEGLWRKLGEVSQRTGSASGMIYVPELATFLNRRDYTSTMIAVLMDIFDCPDKLPPRELVKETTALQNVAVSAIFCSNETMLGADVPEHAMKGGLPSRMITIHEKDSGGRRVALLDEVPLPSISRDWLIGELTRFRFVQGKAKISPDGRKWFREWYAKLAERPIDDENLEPFFARLSDHMLRVALGLSVSQMEDTQAPVVITDLHFTQADALLEYVIARLPNLYRFLAMGPFGADYAKVLRMLELSGGEVDLREVRKKMSHKLPPGKVNELVDALVNNGEAVLIKKENQRYFLRRD